MNDELAGKLINELKMVRIALGGINPDPAQTIQDYRDQRAAQQRAADQLVTTTDALVEATRRLSWATWVLVALTVAMVTVQIIALLKGAR